MKLLSSFLCVALGASAQSFVSPPENLELAISERFPGTSISYKQVHNLCETTEGVRSFSGYVHLPKSFIPDAAHWDEDATASVFFWYFEARNDPENAPTAIYLAGGPGYTVFDGSSVFPCYVNPDSNSTTINEYSWNNNVNMLYIEQPLATGFSYNSLANGTLNLLTEEFTPADGDEVPEATTATLPATVDITPPTLVTNTTMSSARTLWRFSQVWFNEFPERITSNEDISIWGVSYGGFFAPVSAAYFVRQNALIEEYQHELANATTLNIATVGVINGMLDTESMVLGLLDYAVNNTYDLTLYDPELVRDGLEAVTAAEVGCFDQIADCRAAVAELDPESIGNNEMVNGLCVNATQACFGPTVVTFQTNSPYFHFDISVNSPGSFPTEYETALFNQPWVQAELGVPLNYTRTKNSIGGAFLQLTGDAVRYGLDGPGFLLDSGINLAMVYGDRDYRCNWFSAENASLHIPFASDEEFAAAGYATITTDSSHEGGLVREYGGLSFSRIFQAGHSAGGFQPETVSAVFERAMFRLDIATGGVDLLATEDYQTTGESDVRSVRNELPEPIENICYQLYPVYTCTDEQKAALEDGSAEIEDWVVVSPAGTKGVRGVGGNNETIGGGGSTNGTVGSGGQPGSGGETGGNDDESSAGGKLSTSFVAVLAAIFLSATLG